MQIPKNYKISQCIARYEKTLEKNTELKTIEPLKVEHDGKFNQEALRKIIDGMQVVDRQLQRYQQRFYQKPEKEDLYKNLNERKLIAQQKLAQQYHQVAYQNKQRQIKINKNFMKTINDEFSSYQNIIYYSSQNYILLQIYLPQLLKITALRKDKFSYKKQFDQFQLY